MSFGHHAFRRMWTDVNVYYVSSIDDYSHKTWIYLLKSNNEVFGKFKEFKALVENLTEWKIKTL